MKIQSKLTVLSSVAVLAASPLALAGKGTPETVDVVEVADEADFGPAICPAAPEVETGSSEEPADHAACDHAVDSGGECVDVEVTDPAEVVADGEGAVPIDWVKRGGGDNPDVMFYNTAGGEAPVFKGETSAVSKELGQDEKGTAIEAGETAVVPQINREKKGPVALIKKGRVFLR